MKKTLKPLTLQGWEKRRWVRELRWPSEFEYPLPCRRDLNFLVHALWKIDEHCRKYPEFRALLVKLLKCWLQQQP